MLASAGGFDGFVGVGEGLLEGVQHGLHLVQLLPDTPQGTPFAVHGPAGDQILGDGAEAEESVEFFGDGEVLAEDFDIRQVQQILGDGDGLGADVAGRQRVGGFVPDRDLDVAVVAGESQVGIELLTASTPRRNCSRIRRGPRCAGRRDRRVPACPRPQVLRQSRAMPTASSPSGSSRDRLMVWIGACQSTSMVLWSSNRPGGEGAGDELAEGVAEHPCHVKEMSPTRSGTG